MHSLAAIETHFLSFTDKTYHYLVSASWSLSTYQAHHDPCIGGKLAESLLHLKIKVLSKKVKKILNKVYWAVYICYWFNYQCDGLDLIDLLMLMIN